MPRDGVSPADLQACREILRRGSKTFALAARVLARDVEEPATVLYAFCRISDDLVDDGVVAPDVALEELERRVGAIYQGRPTDHPVDRALTIVAPSRGLPAALLRALLEGYGWDAASRRYSTFDDLCAYAARVAGSVGAAMAIFMGVTDPATLGRACALGVAMQLTNVARDVGEDARRGRVYLPLEWLAEEAISVDMLFAGAAPRAGLTRVIDRLLVAADKLYLEGDIGIEALPRRHRPSMRAARLLYSDIGRSIRKNDFDAVGRRAVVTLPRKLWLLFRSLFSLRVGEPRREALPATRFLIDACESGSG